VRRSTVSRPSGAGCVDTGGTATPPTRQKGPAGSRDSPALPGQIPSREQLNATLARRDSAAARAGRWRSSTTPTGPVARSPVAPPAVLWCSAGSTPRPTHHSPQRGVVRHNPASAGQFDPRRPPACRSGVLRGVLRARCEYRARLRNRQGDLSTPWRAHRRLDASSPAASAARRVGAARPSGTPSQRLGRTIHAIEGRSARAALFDLLGRDSPRRASPGTPMLRRAGRWVVRGRVRQVVSHRRVL
jgi:hypothetical protein